jgi:hypothetical protein
MQWLEIAQILTFSITASNLELVKSGAKFPADNSVLTTGSPDQRVSFLWCTGVRDSNLSPRTLSLLGSPMLDSNEA